MKFIMYLCAAALFVTAVSGCRCGCMNQKQQSPSAAAGETATDDSVRTWVTVEAQTEYGRIF